MNEKPMMRFWVVRPSTRRIFRVAARKQKIENATTSHVYTHDYQSEILQSSNVKVISDFKASKILSEITNDNIKPIIIVYEKQTLDALNYLTSNEAFMNLEPASITECEMRIVIKLMQTNDTENIIIPSSDVQNQ
ncbi:Hypothetical_protein [Hexamita inflata]|uniref:Hypothetical_protein n=1 Tax=Hexamita inflata TaxID=28002 RepID=A0AA86P6N5_9EUKA|nr:Hypothetical protein HINF_LOCUS20862 [Hexamita inflata]